MLKNMKTKFTEAERGEGGIQGANEIFVEPLRFFHLKADTLHVSELFLRLVYDKSYGEVV